MRNFDIVQALITLAGKLQARRIARLKAREVALVAAIDAATKGLVATQRERQDQEVRSGRIGY